MNAMLKTIRWGFLNVMLLFMNSDVFSQIDQISRFDEADRLLLLKINEVLADRSSKRTVLEIEITNSGTNARRISEFSLAAVARSFVFHDQDGQVWKIEPSRLVMSPREFERDYYIVLPPREPRPIHLIISNELLPYRKHGQGSQVLATPNSLRFVAFGQVASSDVDGENRRFTFLGGRGSTAVKWVISP